jgi:hypothetical protein
MNRGGMFRLSWTGHAASARGGCRLTVWDLLQLCRRFWILVVAGVAATAACAVSVVQQPGTYSGEVDVVLLAPPSATYNVFAETTSSLVMLAGVVARISGGPGGAARSVSDEVTLVGEGTHVGYSIQQPNAGGQWEYRFEQPVLHVESAGRTLGEAESQMNLALANVREALDKLERESQVSASSLVTLQMTPNEPVYTLLHGSRSRASAATAAAGLLLILGAVFAAQHWRGRRSNRHAVGYLTT